MGRFIDISNQVFGRLKVLYRVPPPEWVRKKKETYWLCECSCDSKNIVTVTGYRLKSGHTQSCGCLQKERIIEHIDKHRVWKYDIGDNIIDDKRNLTIIDRFLDRIKTYKYKCNKCGFDYGTMAEYTLKKGIGCSCCAGITVVEGINDIPTTAPWMVKYFQGGYDKAKLYTRSSDKKVTMICPDCGKEKDVAVSRLYSRRTIACKCSGIGKRYPERFMSCVLNQLEVSYMWGYRPEWLIDEHKSQREFDFRVDDIIIEIDGELGHGKTVHSKSKITVEESLRIDNWKDAQALKNGIHTVVRISADKSKMDYLKRNIVESLSGYFDFGCVDWNKCDEEATKNIVKEVSVYYAQNPSLSILELSKVFSLHIDTIRKYITQGTKFGWCDFQPQDVCKQVMCLNTMEIFGTLINASIFASLKRTDFIKDSCAGKMVYAGTHPETNEYLVWRYVRDIDNMNDLEIEQIVESAQHNIIYKNNTRPIAVICITTGDIFESSESASRQYNIDSSSIKRCCQGKLKSAGKHSITKEPLKWMYYDLYINNNSKI